MKMKTAKEVLNEYYDADNSVDENAILKAMKVYAVELAKASLETAASNAQIMHYVINDFSGPIEKECFAVPKDVVLDIGSVHNVLIKEAYGDLYNLLKGRIDNKGWYDYWDDIMTGNPRAGLISSTGIEIEYGDFKYRPKSLQILDKLSKH